jgi:hypothetical protein
MVLSPRMVQLENDISKLKRQLEYLWEKNYETDYEVLKVADKIDKLLNQYQKLAR